MAKWLCDKNLNYLNSIDKCYDLLKSEEEFLKILYNVDIGPLSEQECIRGSEARPLEASNATSNVIEACWRKMKIPSSKDRRILALCRCWPRIRAQDYPWQTSILDLKLVLLCTTASICQLLHIYRFPDDPILFYLLAFSRIIVMFLNRWV